MRSSEACAAPHGRNMRRGRHPNYERRSRPGNIAPAPSSNGNIGSTSSGVDKAESCSSKVVADCSSHSATSSSLGHFDEKSGTVPKIKWGNLDDDALVISKCCADSSGNALVGCSQLASLNDGSAVNISGALLNISVEESAAAIDPLPEKTAYESISRESHEENCREVTEIPREDLMGASGNVSCCADDGEAHVESLNTSHCEDGVDSATSTISCAPCSSVVSHEMSLPESQSFNNNHQDSELALSMLPVIANAPTEESLSTAGNAPLPLDNVVATIEEHLPLKDDITVIDDGRDESKERFRQRLWCFLFENLNRAIDELYLLCELECDIEQMDEATLVLDEAGSDFKELKSRVEDFEHCKRLPSQLVRDGMARPDHRRPHALSWEVTRCLPLYFS